MNQGTRRVTVPGSDGATPVAEAIAVEATEDEINGNQINGEDAAAAGWQPLVPAGPGFAGARRLCRDAVRRLGVRGAAVTVRGGRNQELLHATDQVIARLDDLQIVVGEGPGRDAFEFRVPVLEPDLDSQNGMARWPVFGREATAVGAAAVFAFPLQAGAVPFGVLQYQLNEGPGLDAVRGADTLGDQAMLLAENLGVDRRWPCWAPAAVQLGLHAVIAVRLFTHTCWGALHLYSQRPRDYDDLDMQAARVVAAHASVVLAHTSTTEDLRRAMTSRNLIGQAQGILMARQGLTADQAFTVLRTHSQNQNVRLVALAEQVTRTGQLPGTDQDRRPDRIGRRTRRPAAWPTVPAAHSGSRHNLIDR